MIDGILFFLIHFTDLIHFIYLKATRLKILRKPFSVTSSVCLQWHEIARKCATVTFSLTINEHLCLHEERSHSLGSRGVPRTLDITHDSCQRKDVRSGGNIQKLASLTSPLMGFVDEKNVCAPADSRATNSTANSKALAWPQANWQLLVLAIHLHATRCLLKSCTLGL